MSQLASDRFYKSQLYKGFQIGEGPNATFHKTPYTRYTYESANRRYDVDVRDSDGAKSYHINHGFDTEPNRYHKAIESHFGIQASTEKGS